jgi:hypothetical protein
MLIIEENNGQPRTKETAGSCWNIVGEFNKKNNEIYDLSEQTLADYSNNGKYG